MRDVSNEIPPIDPDGDQESGRRRSLGRRGLVAVTLAMLVIEPSGSLIEQWLVLLDEFGYRITSAHDLEAARSRALGGGIDVILMNVAIGRQRGIELIRSIRRSGVDVPIVSLTTSHDDAIEVRALDAGADDHVDWPVPCAVLDAHIRAVLRRSDDMPHDLLRVDDVLLEPSQQRVTRRGVVRTLTPAQTEILRVLMRHAGHVVPREELEHQLPDSWSDRHSNVVDVHIRALRGKIDEPFGCRSIRTVRGVGYRFERHDDS